MYLAQAAAAPASRGAGQVTQLLTLHCPKLGCQVLGSWVVVARQHLAATVPGYFHQFMDLEYGGQARRSLVSKVVEVKIH